LLALDQNDLWTFSDGYVAELWRPGNPQSIESTARISVNLYQQLEVTHLPLPLEEGSLYLWRSAARQPTNVAKVVSMTSETAIIQPLVKQSNNVWKLQSTQKVIGRTLIFEGPLTLKKDKKMRRKYSKHFI